MSTKQRQLHLVGETVREIGILVGVLLRWMRCSNRTEFTRGLFLSVMAALLP